MTSIRRIGSQAAIYGLGYGFSRLLGFALLPLYTRCFSPAEYGILAILTVTGQVAAILSEVGMGAAMFRELIYQETDRRTVESTVVLFLAGMSGLVLCLAWVLSPWLSSVLWETGEHSWLLRLTFLGAAFSFLEAVFLARLRIEQKPVLYASLAVVRFVVSAGMTVWFLVVLRRGLLGLVESTACVAALFALLYCAILWRDLALTFSLPVLRRLVRFGAPLLPANVASTVTASSDRYFIQYYAGAAQVGLYSLGYTVGQVVGLFVNAIQLAWPAQMYEIAKKPGAEATLSRLLTAYTAIMAWLALAVTLAATDIVHLMSTPDYYAAVRIVPWVAAAYVFLGASHIVNTALPVRDKMHLAGLVAAGAAVINLALNLWLVSHYGSMGAAWAAVASYAALAVLLAAVNLRVWRIPYEYGRLALLAFAWVVTAYVSQLPTLAGATGLALRLLLLCGYASLAWAVCRHRPAPST